MTEEKKKDPRTVMLNGTTLSFTDSLRTAKPTVKDGVPKHTCNILIIAGSPNEAANKAKILGAMRAACVAEFGEGKEEFFKVIAEDNPARVAYRKGERFKNSETQEVYKGYAGNMVIAGAGPGGSKNPKRPKLFDRRKRVLRDQAAQKDVDSGNTFALDMVDDIFYSGTLADTKVSFYCVSGKDQGGNGLFCTIEAIRSHEQGERMAGGSVQTSAEEFEDLDDDLDTDDTPATGSTGGGDSDFD